jgi:hypothetical protein
MPKDLLFLEECLLKLQTPMPQNKKEKGKRSLTSFQKIRVSQMEPLVKVELMLLNQSNIASTPRRLFAGPSPIERLRLTSVFQRMADFFLLI